LKTSDGVNAQNILAGKCAEYSSTNETTGSSAFRYLPPAAEANSARTVAPDVISPKTGYGI